MKKFFASVCIVSTFLSVVGIVAINCTSPAWEIIADADLQNEGQQGGDCYILDTIQNCPTGNSVGGCRSVACELPVGGSWRCPVPNSGVFGIDGPTAVVQKTEYYYPNAKKSEGGADGYSNKTIVCIETQHCGACSDDGTGSFYCGADPNPTKDERDAVKLSSQLCQ